MCHWRKEGGREKEGERKVKNEGEEIQREERVVLLKKKKKGKEKEGEDGDGGNEGKLKGTRMGKWDVLLKKGERKGRKERRKREKGMTEAVKSY